MAAWNKPFCLNWCKETLVRSSKQRWELLGLSQVITSVQICILMLFGFRNHVLVKYREACTFLLLVILFDLLFKTQLFGISKLQHSEVTQCCLYWVHHFQITPPSYGLRAIFTYHPALISPYDFSYDFIVLLFVDCLSAITISSWIIIIYILHTNTLELCVFNYFKFFTQSRSNLLG